VQAQRRQVLLVVPHRYAFPVSADGERPFARLRGIDGEIRADISPKDHLYADASLCLPAADEGLAYSQRMVALLVDGLRYGTDASQPRP